MPHHILLEEDIQDMTHYVHRFTHKVVLIFVIMALMLPAPVRAAPIEPTQPGDLTAANTTVALTASQSDSNRNPTVAAPAAPSGQQLTSEIEPNNVYTQATPIASGTTTRGNLFPNGDVDYYAFTAQAGDHVYAATMTSFSAGSSTNSQLTVLASDGTTVIEFDNDNGTYAAQSSSIAGTVIPATGTYYLQVNDYVAVTASERGYELHFRLHSGAPTPEVESNDTSATATPLAASGWMSGTRDPAAAAEQDWYALPLNAGDTVFLSLDLDPERDNITWTGRLGFAYFGNAGDQTLFADDAGTADTVPSEALFMTVKNAGT
jgi:hypothetical protein